MPSIVRHLGVILAVITLSAPATAQEECVQSDIAGTWEFFIGGGVKGGPWTGWSACRIRISGNGTPNGPCVDDNGAASRIAGGRLTVRPNCRISGRLIVQDPTTGVRGALVIPRAVLSVSGDVLAGVATIETAAQLHSAPFQMYRL